VTALGRYELITRIGQGGMAEVQLALQRGPAGFEKLVVVKLVHENLASQKPFVDMLLDEARIAALVKHPNVVDIYDLGEADGRYFIAMEYLEGEPLLAVLRAGRDGQRLDVLSTARLVADTAEGLDAAHELRSMAGDPIELVHHDVSLGNIVVLYNGAVKLVDFGVAKATQSATAHSRIQGKYGYMAPEKLRGEPGDRRSDIWSLGCVLWEALTLRRLFKGTSDSDTMQQVFEIPVLAPSKVNGDVPADFDPVALRALHRDPARRYSTAKAMAADLEDVLRRRGYAAKNDAIARYMQATFADHIAARKKLLQEVSSKGRPSPDVLEAAFNLGALAAGSPVSSTASIALGHGSSPGFLLGQGSAAGIPLDRGSPSTAPGPAATWGLPPELTCAVVRATVPIPSRVEASGSASPATAAAPRPTDASARATAAMPELATAKPAEPAAAKPAEPAGPPADEPTTIDPPIAAQQPWTLWAAAAGAVAAASLVIGLLISRHGSATSSPLFDPEPTAAAPATPAAQAMPLPSPAVSPSAHRTPIAHGPTSEPPADQPAVDASAIETTAEPSKPHHVQSLRPPSPPRPAPEKRDEKHDEKHEKIDPQELYREGFQAWARGDGKTTLALCKRITQASPGFAPAWRLLGLVHEKLGDRAAARSALEKYLQLSPAAVDAAGIRERLNAL
jgi:serine/threonine-protein kinase